MNALEITEICKSYKNRKILENINLECKTGEIVGIFGRNGTGKSTLLKLIFGTVKADSINIKINSKTIHQKNVINSKMIAYLPQDTFLPKQQSVRNVVRLFFSNGDEQDKIFYAPQVSNFEKIKIGQLSIGQLRYLELLIIGNLNHQFLMLDEPFSMVEPIYKNIIKELLSQLKLTKGIILTDHYYNDVLEITDVNYLIKNGEKIKIQNKEDLVKNEYLNSDK